MIHYEYVIENNLVHIKLYNKKFKETKVTIIDLFNLDKFLSHEYAWHLAWEREIDDYYVKSSVYLGIIDGKPKYKSIYLHKFLANISDEQYGDHINNVSLDNRMKNIREIDNANNGKNRKAKNKNNSSGYRNVTRMNNWWRVQLQVNGKNHLFPEKFEDVDMAGSFAEKMRKEHYGEYAGKS